MESWEISLLLGLLFLVEGVAGARRCPPKSCVPLEECPVLAARLRSRDRGQRSSVSGALCGYQGLRAKVCCPLGDVADAEMIPPRGVHEGHKTPAERETTTRHRMTEGTQPDQEELLPLQCGRRGVSSRIFGGTSASLGSYPWIVAMRYKRESEEGGLERVLCAGSLISSRYVLTAAHCIDSTRTKGWQLTSLSLGDWQLSTDPDCAYKACAPKAIVARVETTIVHEEYNSTTLDHDIALLRLDQTVNFSWAVQPICLPPRTFAPGEVALGKPVVAIGWGMTKTYENSDVLQEATLPIANPSICKKNFPNNFRLNGNQMCAGGGSEDTCLGDSGGPIMNLNNDTKFYLLGVTSYGSSYCGTKGHPAVYTSVAHYSDWIRDSIKP